jgi:hypothetical protein
MNYIYVTMPWFQTEVDAQQLSCPCPVLHFSPQMRMCQAAGILIM